MKVLHINTSQTGGAAMCAIRISKALSEEGIESRMLFAEGISLPGGIKGAIATSDNIFWNRNLFLRIIKKILSFTGIWLVDVEKAKHQLNKANKTRLYIHQPLSSFKSITHHPLVEWADIIHLHWVTGFIDYPTFFKDIKKPIVWTLHDKYPAVGVMHYSSNFYPIPDNLKKIDALFRRIKRKGVSGAKNLNIVAISEVMIDICKHSDVLGGYPVTLIHNGVDASLFLHYNKQETRANIDLMPNGKIFLFSSFFINDPNKGLNRAIAALETIDVPQKTLVCIGSKYEGQQPQCSFPLVFTGLIKDPIQLSMYYSAADFFLQCSYEETFSQTPLEAMACGTPVISTPCSGAKDIIKSFNGVICRSYDADAIAEGITEGLSRHYNSDEIRQYIVNHFNYNIIAKQYIKLYMEITDKIHPLSYYNCKESI